MQSGGDERIRELKARLLEGMREYLRDDGTTGSRKAAAYEAGDIERCGKILDELAAAISRSGGREEALAHVRKTILALNALNDSCEGELIETDQRELICELIIELTARGGFNPEREDITLEWREW